MLRASTNKYQDTDRKTPDQIFLTIKMYATMQSI